MTPRPPISQQLDLLPSEMHAYKRLHSAIKPNERLLEDLVESLLYRAPDGFALVKKPELIGKGVPVVRPAA